MARNTERRAVLLDAAIEVLATEGARGLTFRMVDAEARVPIGTTSNYFPSRDALMMQVGAHVYVRFAPDAEELARADSGPTTAEHLITVMQGVVARLVDRRSVYLALLELRLEATRRPALRDMLTQRVRDDLEFNIANHRSSGLPGDRSTVLWLYLALTGLVIDQLTLPGVLGPEGSTDAVVEGVVRAALRA